MNVKKYDSDEDEQDNDKQTDEFEEFDNNAEIDDNDEHALIDDDLVEMLNQTAHEDPLITEFGTSTESNDERLTEVRDWMSDSDDYRDQTRISPTQSSAMSICRTLPELYPELDNVLNKIIKMIENKERYNVSVGGYGRDQQVEVLTSLFKSNDSQESENYADKIESLGGGD